MAIESPNISTEKIKYTLSKVSQDNPRGVVLFAVRAALRVLPMLADSKGSFRFNDNPGGHGLAVWRGLYISLNDVVPSDSLGKATQATRAAAFSCQEYGNNSAISAVNAASSAMSAVGALIKLKGAGFSEVVVHAVSAYSHALRTITLLTGSMELMREMERDLGSLSLGSLDISFPLWEGDNPLEHQLNTFIASCYEYDLHEVVDDYRDLIKGGIASWSVIENGWDKYEAKLVNISPVSGRLVKERARNNKKETSKKDLIVENSTVTSMKDDIDEIESTSAEKVKNISASETENVDIQYSHDSIVDNDNYSPDSQYSADRIADVDHLNRDNSIAAISRWLDEEKNSSHIALGLFGDWGAGKSTFLHLLKRRLLKNEYKSDKGVEKNVEFVWGDFNAWQYEHSGNIQAGLAQEAVTALKRDLNSLEKLVLTVRYAWLQYRFSLFSTLLLAIVSILTWFFGLNIESHEARSLGVVASSIITTSFLVYSFSSFKKILAHPLAEKFKTYLRLPNFGEYLGTVPIMREHIKALTELRLNSFKNKNITRRFIFAIDDLDRCSPGGVVKTLEAVRLVMDLENVVVIIAIDQRIALASLALNYKDLSEHHAADPLAIARDYLSKVINTSLVLNKLSENESNNYLENCLWTDDVGKTSGSMSENSVDKNPEIDKKDGVKIARIDKEPGLTPAVQKSAFDEGIQEDAPMKSGVLDNESEEKNNALDESRSNIIGLSRRQKDTFKEWANKLSLSNPRQLKRLNNAYSLIRLCYKDEDQGLKRTSESTDSSQKIPMYQRLIMMLWLESLHELPSIIRTPFIGAISQELDTNWDNCFTAKYNEQIEHWQALKDAIPSVSIRKEMLHEVKAFVLPAIDTPLPLNAITEGQDRS